LLIFVRPEESGEIAQSFQQRGDLDKIVVVAGEMGTGAGPRPILGSIAQPGPNRVQRHITGRVGEVRLIHQDRSKSSLPQVTGPAVAGVDEARIAAMGIGEGPAQSVCIGRDDDQVNMIGHQAVGSDARPRLPRAIGKQLAVDAKIILFEKGRTAPVAALRHMIGHAGNNEPGKAGHP